jgi:hypothetical protein
MSEKINTEERIPSSAEIHEFFHFLFEGKEFELRRTRSDEEGLYLFEAQLKEPDGDGYLVELTYCRKGSFSETKSTETRIDVTYYDADGAPVGGKPLKILKNGSWVNA